MTKRKIHHTRRKGIVTTKREPRWKARWRAGTKSLKHMAWNALALFGLVMAIIVIAKFV